MTHDPEEVYSCWSSNKWDLTLSCRCRCFLDQPPQGPVMPLSWLQAFVTGSLDVACSCTHSGWLSISVVSNAKMITRHNTVSVKRIFRKLLTRRHEARSDEVAYSNEELYLSKNKFKNLYYYQKTISLYQLSSISSLKLMLKAYLHNYFQQSALIRHLPSNWRQVGIKYI